VKAEKWLEKNRLAKILLNNSHLSRENLLALLLYYWKPGTTFEEIAAKLGIQRAGAWKRWKKGKDAVLRSFYTIELGIYCGVLDPEVAEVLLEDLRDYISLVKGGENPERIKDRIELRMLKLLGK